MELWLFAARDGNVEVEKRRDTLQFGAVRYGNFETEDFAARGRIDGRMDRLSAPLDEKGEKPGSSVLKIESLPFEKAAVGALARAGRGAVEGKMGIAKANCEGVEVAGMRRPANETRRCKLLQTIVVGCAGLCGVRRDDFKVVSVAQREQSVARAPSGMNAAECGGYSGMLLDERDACLEVARAEKNVIENGGHVSTSPGSGRPGECACGHREE